MTTTTKPITREQVAAAAHRANRAQAELFASLRIQDQWTAENDGQYHDEAGRVPFPVDTFDGTCPACGKEGTVQSVCLTTHVWGNADVTQGACILVTDADMRTEDDCTMHDHEPGTLSFVGDFEWMDDSIDSHISCYECGTEWAEPEKIEYR